MKTLVCTNPGNFEYRESARPQPAAGNAIIRIRRVGICGTDLHAFGGTQPYFSYPRILGHELAAELVEADPAIGFEKNEALTVIPYFNCGYCFACWSGKPNCCERLQVLGVHIDGGMSEYISVPSYSLVHGKDFSLDELAIIEPLAIGLHGINRAAVKENEFVLIIGAGPIGIAAMEAARAKGAIVIAAEVNEWRLQFCREQLQLKYVVDMNSTNVTEQLMEITNGEMPAVIVDATGNLNAINNAFQFMAHGGRYVLIGLQKGDISFSHPAFHKREATLMSSRNATRADFESVMEWLQQRRKNPVPFITHRMKFEEVKERFEHLLKPGTHVIKAVIDF